MKRVLVTRPEPGASATAEKLKALGFEPVVLPLSKIVALQPPEIKSGDIGAVAVTSASALRHAPDYLLAGLRGKPCFAVGEQTAIAAKEAGFVDVQAGNGNADALAGKLTGWGAAGGSVAYLCGRVRRPKFERSLRDAGLKVVAVETYDTLDISYAGEELRQRLAGRIDAALTYSVKAAEALNAILSRPDLAETFSHTVHCCLSRRIAAELGSSNGPRLVVAASPNEAALLALLAP